MILGTAVALQKHSIVRQITTNRHIKWHTEYCTTEGCGMRVLSIPTSIRWGEYHFRPQWI